MLLKRLSYFFNQKRIDPEKITTVHDDDLEEFLNSIGVLQDIIHNLKRCKFCKEIINLKNLQTVFPDSGSISFVCVKPHCIYQFLQYYRDLSDG